MRQFTPDWDRPSVPLHVTPPPKLVLLSILTGGVYNLIWFYRHWRAIETATGNRKFPISQALGAFWSIFMLARRINLNAANSGARRSLFGLLIPLAYILVSPLGLAPGVAGALGLLNAVPLAALQSEANRGNRFRGDSQSPSWKLSWSEAALLLVCLPATVYSLLEGAPG